MTAATAFCLPAWGSDSSGGRSSSSGGRSGGSGLDGGGKSSFMSLSLSDGVGAAPPVKRQCDK